MKALNTVQLAQLAQSIKHWGLELGLAEVRIGDVDLAAAEEGLLAWLANGCHGTMSYMQAHGLKRARPAELVPGAVRAILARIDYLPAAENAASEQPAHRRHANDWRAIEWARIKDPQAAQISLYARGRDYHKVLRSRLQHLARQIEAAIGAFGYRVFVDSAPVMEVALAEKAGLGWRGKHTLLLNRQAGSMFFLGEILTDLPLPCDAPVSSHCGQCRSCIDVCPTGAIVAPYQLDARRCISYLTIEFKGSIPLPLRRLIGNRVYGCDDCQLVCPWNKFAAPTGIEDFAVRNGLDQAQLLDLFAWTEEQFLRLMEGSAIRRIGYECWLRNLAVGLGNALATGAAVNRSAIIAALERRAAHPSALVREHVAWALTQAAI